MYEGSLTLLEVASLTQKVLTRELNCLKKQKGQRNLLLKVALGHLKNYIYFNLDLFLKDP